MGHLDQTRKNLRPTPKPSADLPLLPLESSTPTNSAPDDPFPEPHPPSERTHSCDAALMPSTPSGQIFTDQTGHFILLSSTGNTQPSPVPVTAPQAAAPSTTTAPLLRVPTTPVPLRCSQRIRRPNPKHRANRAKALTVSPPLIVTQTDPTLATDLCDTTTYVAYTAIHSNMGELVEYQQLLKSSDGVHWEWSCTEEVARLAQGFPPGGIPVTEGTNTIKFIPVSAIPKGFERFHRPCLCDSCSWSLMKWIVQHERS